jgi:hypothetical protein
LFDEKAMKNVVDKEHPFSVELTSSDHLQRIEVSSGPRGRVLIEGELGGDVSVELIEGIMLQISGEKGVLRIDVEAGDLKGVLGSLSSKIYAGKE